MSEVLETNVEKSVDAGAISIQALDKEKNVVKEVEAIDDPQIKENEDKDISHFFYLKGVGRPGDIIIKEEGIKGPAPVYRFDEKTKTYNCVNYTAYAGYTEEKIANLKKQYKWHEITDIEEKQSLEDLEKKLKIITRKQLFETGDEEIFNMVHDNRKRISDDAKNIFKDKTNQYLINYKYNYPQGFQLKLSIDDKGRNAFDVIPSAHDYQLGVSEELTITFGPE